jgi:hypothetical protein
MTRSGLSISVVSHIIAMHPDGIAEDVLMKKLAKCFKDDVIDSYQIDCIRRRPRKGASTNDHETLLHRAKCHFLRVIIRHMRDQKFVDVERVMFYKPSTKLRAVKK